jgi:AAA ATPase domain
VKLTLSLPRDKSEELFHAIKAIKAGQFEEYGVVDAELKDAGETTLKGVKIVTSLVETTPFFVRRHQELDQLRCGLQDAMDGRSQVVLILGGAGIGKTRLLQQLQEIARRDDMQVCYGRSYAELVLPYLSFVGALHSQLEQILNDAGRTFGPDVKLLEQLLRQDGISSPAASSSMPEG